MNYWKQGPDNIYVAAHRGWSEKYPENTMAAFRAAYSEGYGCIEFDPKYTSDGQLVILHDWKLTRTARRPDGSEILPEKEITSITLDEARTYDYGLWFSSKFKGEKIPLLRDLLDFARETGMPVKVDNCWERFPLEMKEKLFEELQGYGDKIYAGITCSGMDTLRWAAERLPAVALHYDGGDLSEQQLREIADAAAGHELTVWVCFDNELTKWFHGTKATQEVCRTVKQYGKLGIWILSHQEEAIRAVREFDADFIETTGHIKPNSISAG